MTAKDAQAGGVHAPGRRYPRDRDRRRAGWIRGANRIVGDENDHATARRPSVSQRGVECSDRRPADDQHGRCHAVHAWRRLCAGRGEPGHANSSRQQLDVGLLRRWRSRRCAVLPRRLQRRSRRSAQRAQRHDLRPRGRRRRHQSGYAPGGMGPVARGLPAVRLVGQPALHGGSRTRSQRDRGASVPRAFTRTRTRIEMASESSATGFNPTVAFRAGSEHDATCWIRILS